MISSHDHGNCELCDTLETESENRRTLVICLVEALQEIISDSSCSAYIAQVAEEAAEKWRLSKRAANCFKGQTDGLSPETRADWKAVEHLLPHAKPSYAPGERNPLRSKLACGNCDGLEIECDRLRAENAEFVAVLQSAAVLRPKLLAQYDAVPECVLDFCNHARAALAKRKRAA